MASIETMINWMDQRRGKVKYSMAARYGPGSYDCSSAVYNALIAGGFFPSGTIGNTTSLFGHLEKHGWIKMSSPKRGDIFVWGAKHSASGNYGHTGIFVDSKNVIHCNYGANGISINTYSSVINGAGNPTTTIYRNPNVPDTTPTIDTEEERTAWAIANILSKEGYNLTAIAGICGNFEVESRMKPDTDQVNGPAYGLAQWDGSAYPLIGSATRNGREYVQRLMKAGGIGGDYRTAEPQARLVEWCMHNGQWNGRVSPTTVTAYKNVNDITQAATAFMRNFERPGVEKLDDRIAGANKWYNYLQNKDYEDQNSEGYETMTNVGELELLGIANGRIVAEGWHFSSDKDLQYIVFINAQTDAELGRVKAEPVERPDLKEKYPNVLGVELAGFNVSLEVANETAVYVKGIRSNTLKNDELIFDKIIVFEQAFDPEVEDRAKFNERFYIEIYKKDKLVKRGRKILNELSWSNELMYVPTSELVLPIEYRQYITTREEIKIYINKKIFHGQVIGIEENKVEETITVGLAHLINEWQYRQLSTNLAAKNRTVNDIYSTLDFRYPGWNVNYLQDAASRVIDYVYSRQNKLEGLTKTCELTPDLFWRVGFEAGRTLDIGTFGEKKPYLFSKKPAGRQNIRIISEPVIRHQFENVINMATVYGEKSDSGMSSMSLREVYAEDGAQDPDFPVVILKNGINNERGYDYIEFTKLAPNNELEYAVIDIEGIALEGGVAIEGTFAFNDLAPFNTDGEEISEEDRAKASKTAYDAAMRRLKQSRRQCIVELEVEQLPDDLSVGDRIRLLYDSTLFTMAECSNYLKKILSVDDWFYILSIQYNFDKNGVEYNTVSLGKFLQTERESDWQ